MVARAEAEIAQRRAAEQAAVIKADQDRRHAEGARRDAATRAGRPHARTAGAAAGPELHPVAAARGPGGGAQGAGAERGQTQQPSGQPRPPGRPRSPSRRRVGRPPATGARSQPKKKSPATASGACWSSSSWCCSPPGSASGSSRRCPSCSTGEHAADLGDEQAREQLRPRAAAHPGVPSTLGRGRRLQPGRLAGPAGHHVHGRLPDPGLVEPGPGRCGLRRAGHPAACPTCCSPRSPARWSTASTGARSPSSATSPRPRCTCRSSSAAP